MSIEGQGNVNIGGRFFVVNTAISQISTHPLVWAQIKVQRPWALFRETTVSTSPPIDEQNLWNIATNANNKL